MLSVAGFSLTSEFYPYVTINALMAKSRPQEHKFSAIDASATSRYNELD